MAFNDISRELKISPESIKCFHGPIRRTLKNIVGQHTHPQPGREKKEKRDIFPLFPPVRTSKLNTNENQRDRPKGNVANNKINHPSNLAHSGAIEENYLEKLYLKMRPQFFDLAEGFPRKKSVLCHSAKMAIGRGRSINRTHEV